ncbi:MAG: carbohydrate-binding domain-containing protein [Chitinispirillia bacterium]|nr:carbohydrate-binding domain-containing protein [Chitinispirillia bacterium]MCL2242061.1 carbohydrate-binding domain-containing protein [Chitinispirillia bacterium]
MNFRKKSTFGLFFAAAALILSCDGNNSAGPGNQNNGGGGTPWTVEEYKCAGNPIDAKLDGSRDDLGLRDIVVIVKYNGDDPATVILPDGVNTIEITASGGHVTVKAPSPRDYINVVVSGTTADGSLKLYGSATFDGLYLNGANITNPRGPAVNIQTNGPVPVYLVGGCGRENYLSDGTVYGPPHIGEDGTAEDAKGAFFSEKRLTFRGNGYLEVAAKGLGVGTSGGNAHAIVADSDIRIESGNITIRESAGDGLHANDDIEITGGTIQIVSRGDAVQNEDTLNTILIRDAKVRLRTTGAKSHGIAGEDSTIIEGGADVRIYVEGNGSKGIRTRGFMGIRGGKTDITATGSRDISSNPANPAALPDTSNAAGIKVGNDIDNHPGEGNMEISGGTLTINARAAKHARGLNIDGSLTVTGGNADIASDGDGIRVRRNFRMTAGTVKSRSTVNQDLDYKGGNLSHTGGTLDVRQDKIAGN